MHSPLKRRLFVSIVCSLFLLVYSFTSNSMTIGLADVPLTKATPESQGLSGTRLKKAVIKINNGDYGKIHSLLITRNNYLVLENYFEGYDRDDLHKINSATKSITSALIGIAIKQGKINGVQAKLMEFFPEYTKLENLELSKENITLENLLAMTAGFKWDELSIPYTNPLNDARKMADSPDPLKYMLDLPMSGSHGKFEYNSGCTTLLGGVLKKACGQSAKEFADDYLFNPLGINDYFWKTYSNGTINTGWGLLMRPIDMARFGILFLNDGRWRGNQIVPKEWCHASTKEHIKASKLKFAYGYHWWRFLNDDPIVSKLAVNDVYFALGYGGQEIVVIPHLHMVVVSTAENYLNMRLFINLLSDHIFPAVIE